MTMVIDSLSSPHRRAQQNPFAPLSPSFRKQLHGREESSSWSILFHRHRFLLTALAVLFFLCSIYLYFAVTLGAGESCAGLIGTEAALCRMERAKASSMSHKGKLKFV